VVLNPINNEEREKESREEKWVKAKREILYCGKGKERASSC
jgi:hypothetical protein